MFKNKIKTLLVGNFLLISTLYAQKAEIIPLKAEKFETFNLTLKNDTYKGKSSIAVVQTEERDNDNRYSFAKLTDIDFHNGIIEINVIGEVKKNAVENARGFVGVAFRIPKDTSKFEVFYIRPTNARCDDQFRRNHTTQYVSYPGFSWQKLRKETPEKYESYTDLEYGAWTKLKIEVKDDKAKLYINGGAQPALLVNDLKQGKDLRGSIGLWLAIGTEAHFSDLKITKWD
jgi:hypothetical protein